MPGFEVSERPKGVASHPHTSALVRGRCKQGVIFSLSFMFLLSTSSGKRSSLSDSRETRGSDEWATESTDTRIICALLEGLLHDRWPRAPLSPFTASCNKKIGRPRVPLLLCRSWSYETHAVRALLFLGYHRGSRILHSARSKMASSGLLGAPTSWAFFFVGRRGGSLEESKIGGECWWGVTRLGRSLPL